MRSSIGVLVGSLLLGLTGPALAAPGDVPPYPPSPLAGLPTDLPDGQVVTLADGDRYEVTSTAQGQAIRGRRWDSTTGTWGPRTVIFRDPDRRCWGVTARGAGTGVAVRVTCGPAFVPDDDGHPFAIVSADTQTWTSRRLPGYGWWTPGVSPDGQQAVWARGDDYYTWTPATGFVLRAATPPPDVVEGEVPMITDDGSVTIAYADNSCSVTFDTYPTSGTPSRQVLSTGAHCNATGVTGIDAHTVAFGDSTDEWSNARLTRPDDRSPWVVAAVAPRSAPGLLSVTFTNTMGAMLIDAPTFPLAAVANGPDELRLQVYDPASQRWQAPTTLITRPGGTKCRPREFLSRAMGFPALSLRCAGADRFVTSTDGATWTALPLHAQTVGDNRPLGLVAVPTRGRTVVVGAGSMTVVPVGVEHRCDIIVPIAADRLLRLTSSDGPNGWPDLLQRSTAQGWKTIHRVRVPAQGECGRVYSGVGGGPRFNVQSRDGSMRVSFVQADGRWDVRVRR